MGVSPNAPDMNPSKLDFFDPMPFFIMAHKYNAAPFGCNSHCTRTDIAMNEKGSRFVSATASAGGA